MLAKKLRDKINEQNRLAAQEELVNKEKLELQKKEQEDKQKKRSHKSLSRIFKFNY